MSSSPVDAAGNDNELMTRSALRHDLLARRPCRSTEALIDSLRSVKLLGANIRIRPDRATILLAAFTGVDESILGDWTLDLHEVPVETDPAGEVLHAASFEFPLLGRGYRTTTRLRRERWFDSWKETHRTTEEVGPVQPTVPEAGHSLSVRWSWLVGQSEGGNKVYSD